MKKNRLAAGVLALAFSITACGCGSEVYEMTDDEEAAVVQYSAHVVSKFNKRQAEGVTDVTKLKAQMEEEEQKEKERKQEEKQQEEQEKQDTKEQKSQTAAEKNTKTAQQAEQKEYVSLSQALKLSKIDASYKGYETAASYAASASSVIMADKGNELLILHVNLKNSGSKTAGCDILSKMPSFMLTVNGDLSVTADTTILLNDLGTYQGKIKAGDTAETVLIFQVKKNAAKSVKSMELQVTAGGGSSQVQLVSGV